MVRKELSLQHFYQLFKDNFLLMLVLTALGMCLGYLVMFHFVTPKYSSQAELFVNQKTEQQMIQFSEVQTSIQLISTYRALITGDSVMNQSANGLDNAYSVSEIREAISIYQPEASQSFYISAEMTSPRAAQQVVTEVVNAFETVIQQVNGGSEGNIHILSLASYEAMPVSPQLSLFVIGGAAIGLLSCLIGILFFDMIDSTVKDLDFFTQEGLVNMGVIYRDVKTEAVPNVRIPQENNRFIRYWDQLKNAFLETFLTKHSVLYEMNAVGNLTKGQVASIRNFKSERDLGLIGAMSLVEGESEMLAGGKYMEGIRQTVHTGNRSQQTVDLENQTVGVDGQKPALLDSLDDNETEKDYSAYVI